MKDMILKKLREEYPGTRFELKEEEPYFISILFDNEKLKEDEKFYDFAFDLADQYLEEKDKNKFALVYDYLNEIDTAYNQSCEKLNYFSSTIQTKAKTRIDYDTIRNLNDFIELVSPYFVVTNMLSEKRTLDNFTNLSKPNFKLLGKFNNVTISEKLNKPSYYQLENLFDIDYNDKLQNVFSLEF